MKGAEFILEPLTPVFYYELSECLERKIDDDDCSIHIFVSASYKHDDQRQYRAAKHAFDMFQYNSLNGFPYQVDLRHLLQKDLEWKYLPAQDRDTLEGNGYSYMCLYAREMPTLFFTGVGKTRIKPVMLSVIGGMISSMRRWIKASRLEITLRLAQVEYKNRQHIFESMFQHEFDRLFRHAICLHAISDKSKWHMVEHQIVASFVSHFEIPERAPQIIFDLANLQLRVLMSPYMQDMLDANFDPEISHDATL